MVSGATLAIPACGCAHLCIYCTVLYVWDKAKNRANLKTHNVDFADAVSVFEDPLALTRPDPEVRREPRFVALGIDGFGRHLVGSPSAGQVFGYRHGSQPNPSANHMKVEYDFSKAKRGAVVPSAAGKTRITIRLDNEVIDWFRARVNDAGGGNYQSLINEALKQYVKQRGLETTLRRLIREELRRVA